MYDEIDFVGIAFTKWGILPLIRHNSHANHHICTCRDENGVENFRLFQGYGMAL